MRGEKEPGEKPSLEKVKEAVKKINTIHLVDFDMEFFKTLEKDADWIALGQENCRNQRYYTICGEDGTKIGIVGVYETDDEQNIAHIVIDQKYRGQGLAAKGYTAVMDTLGLPFLTLTIDLNNVSSLRAAEKLPGVKKVSDAAYEAKFHKAKYIFASGAER